MRWHHDGSVCQWGRPHSETECQRLSWPTPLFFIMIYSNWNFITTILIPFVCDAPKVSWGPIFLSFHHHCYSRDQASNRGITGDMLKSCPNHSKWFVYYKMGRKYHLGSKVDLRHCWINENTDHNGKATPLIFNAFSKNAFLFCFIIFEFYNCRRHLSKQNFWRLLALLSDV